MKYEQIVLKPVALLQSENALDIVELLIHIILDLFRERSSNIHIFYFHHELHKIKTT